jgi:hypothetical protein
MGAKGPVPFSQDPATHTYPEPHQSVHPPTTIDFFQIYCNIIPRLTYFSKQSVMLYNT